jgi:hypothetical protein
VFTPFSLSAMSASPTSPVAGKYPKVKGAECFLPKDKHVAQRVRHRFHNGGGDWYRWLFLVSSVKRPAVVLRSDRLDQQCISGDKLRRRSCRSYQSSLPYREYDGARTQGTRSRDEDTWGPRQRIHPQLYGRRDCGQHEPASEIHSWRIHAPRACGRG